MKATPILVLLTALGPHSLAQPTSPPSRPDYPAFRIISERNIFNANRSTRSTRRGEPERPIRIESFTLLGTLSYDKGRFAFFEGTRPEFRKAARLADSIAGYTIAAIAPGHVKLEAAGREVELRVGMQLKRVDEGDWEVSEARAPSTTPDRSSTPTAAAETNDAAPAENPVGAEGVSDVLKRLMQKREQEMKK